MTILKDIKTIILHTPKTGGSSVRWPAIKKFGMRYACQHCAYKMLPEMYQDYRKVTFVRHPIEWYASRFFFDKKKWDIRQRAKLEPFTDALSNEYQLTFSQTLPRMLDLTEAFSDPKVLQSFKNKVSNEVNNNYQAWWVSYFDDIDGITAESFGHKSLYQWFLDIVGVQHADAVYRLEDEYELGMKKEFGGDIQLLHKNKTGRNTSDEIYSVGMIKSVLEKEKTFIEKYDYRMIYVNS